MNGFDLRQYGLSVAEVRRNLAPAKLYGEALSEEPGCVIADSGALIAFSGWRNMENGKMPCRSDIAPHLPNAVANARVNAVPSGQSRWRKAFPIATRINAKSGRHR